MKTKNRILKVLLNGILIGKLEKKTSASLQFSYNADWLNSPYARPLSLSLPLLEATFEGDVVNNYFDNLLPDNPLIRARIQRKFQIATQEPFDLLASIGGDCVGAIQIIEGEMIDFQKAILCQALDSDEIASILSGYQEYPLGMKDIADDFRISIAGAQEKSAFLYHNKKWNRPIGSTPTSHIFKLPIGFIPHQQLDLSDSCENEWICSKITEAFNMPVAKCEIKNFNNIKALVVERFDRALSEDKKWIMRLPQEDMCQALGISPNLKYQSDGGPGINDIMKLLLGSSNATADRDMFFRSQILFWLLAAIDGHAKNFSLFIEPQGSYRLTPLYDIMSAYPLMAKKQLQPQKIKMAMALRGKNIHYHWHNLQRRHFMETAKNVNYSVDRAEKILDEMLSQVDFVIQKVTIDLPKGFPMEIAQPIFDGMMHIKRKIDK